MTEEYTKKRKGNFKRTTWICGMIWRPSQAGTKKSAAQQKGVWTEQMDLACFTTDLAGQSQTHLLPLFWPILDKPGSVLRIMYLISPVLSTPSGLLLIEMMPTWCPGLERERDFFLSWRKFRDRLYDRQTTIGQKSCVCGWAVLGHQRDVSLGTSDVSLPAKYFKDQGEGCGLSEV